MTTSTVSDAAAAPHRHDDRFDIFAATVQERFAEMAGEAQPLFTTNAEGLFDLFLTRLPVEERQYHTCNCCRQFFSRFGGLAVIDGDGVARSPVWSPSGVPALYTDAAYALGRAVERSKVTGVFLSSEKVWGTPVTGPWTHFAIRPDKSRLYRAGTFDAHQAMALKKQDFGTLSHGLADFDRTTVAQALNLLETDALYRSEKVRGPAQFLLELHDQIASAKGERRRNMIWKAVAAAPAGFATPRSSMVGTLLEDIAAGKSMEAVKRSFAAKMHPLQYQRPQAPARAGNIEQAEKIVEKLGIANSLKRRFARLEEMRLLWSPKALTEPARAGGVFGHLRQQQAAVSAPAAPRQDITWIKFAAVVLPKATRIQVAMAPRMNFCGIVTAVDADAPPILQWDREENRNPVAWYVYHNGSAPSQWGLPSHGWIDATGVMLKPSMWTSDAQHHGVGAIINLTGAQDQNRPSLALFPECLKSELHSIRSTIEAFARAGTPDGAKEGTANGLMIAEKGSDATIRVTTALGVADYRIDRWD